MTPFDAVCVLAVYRRRHAAIMHRLVGGLPREWSVALWALDECAPELAPWTRGVGPGNRFMLLNRLYGLVQPDPRAYTIVTDDDIWLAKGSLGRLVDVSQRAGFALSQPAHARRSAASHAITRRKHLSRARLTSFVEIGPVVVVSPEAREEVLPFPDDIGMGWGLEFTWSDLSAQGLRLGIVDAVQVMHGSQVAGAYDDTVERERLASIFAQRGVSGWEPIQRTHDVWRPWQPTPPWLTARR